MTLADWEKLIDQAAALGVDAVTPRSPAAAPATPAPPRTSPRRCGAAGEPPARARPGPRLGGPAPGRARTPSPAVTYGSCAQRL